MASGEHADDDGVIGRLGRALFLEDKTVVDKRPQPLTHAYVHSVYRNKPVQANTNALVHLYLGCRVLEYLIERGVMNATNGDDHIAKAKKIIQSNLMFIHKTTTAHEEGRKIKTEDFNSILQILVQATAERMIAILGVGEDGKAGAKDALLAREAAPAMKAAAALYVHDVMTLFGLDAPLMKKAESLFRVDANWKNDAAHTDFLNFMRNKLKRGNGTKGYRYVRAAGAGIISMMRDDDGVDAILNRVTDSVARSGPLASDEMVFHTDIPDIEEELEDIPGVFHMERIEVATHAAGLSMFGAAVAQWARHMVEIDVMLGGKFQEIAKGADADDVRDFAADAKAQGGTVSDALLPRVAKTLGEMTLFFVREEEQRPILRAGIRLRLQIAYLSRVCRAIADHEGLALAQGGPAEAARVRSFCAALAAPFDSLAEREFVVLSDGDAHHTTKKAPGFERVGAAMGELNVHIRKTLEREGFVPFDAFSPSKRLKAADEIVEKLAMFFNNQAMHGAGGMRDLLAGFE